MFYIFMMKYTNGDVGYKSVPQEELNDQLAYCQEGKSADWLESYSYEAIEEEW